MAGIGGLIGGIGGAVGDMFAAKADRQQATGYFEAASLYGASAEIATQNAGIEDLSGKIQQVQLDRKIAKTEGTQQAVAATGNVSGGSMGDITRETVQQGSLAKTLVNTNTMMQENAYKTQALGFKAEQVQANATGASLETAAQGKEIAGMFSILGGVAGMMG
jgi:hypothetical protein